MRKIYFILSFLLLFYTTSGQTFRGCPPSWEEFSQKCYQFVFSPQRIYKEAGMACQSVGASLLSVNTHVENRYITDWLQTSDDMRMVWLTSGVYMEDKLKWGGDGTFASDAEQFWLGMSEKDGPNLHVAYQYSGTLNRYGWTKVTGIDEVNYICEIPLIESNTIIESERDFDYGTEVSDPNIIERGPSFLVTPNNLVVIGLESFIFLECVATGSPQPVYHWYKNTTLLRPETDNRYTFTSGKLSIHSPSQILDPDSYQCRAENNFGSILADPVLLSFGYLMEFSNQQPGAVDAIMYQGAVLNCDAPAFNPAVAYAWFRDYTSNFVRPELNLHLFQSSNGNLYFSEVQSTDNGTYHCMVTLIGRPGDTVSSRQPPSRTGLGIFLRVGGWAASDYGPTIHNDFIAVFPQNPIIGQNVRMECLAEGRLPLSYSWTRENRPFSPRVRFEDINRVLLIENIQLSDQGHYTCHVSRGTHASASKGITLAIGAKPYFAFPLHNMHRDQGSKMTWRCEAMARPRAHYTWYKNSQILNTTTGDVEIHENVLRIFNLAERHEGMYQCAATNNHGTTFSSGQLRVLAFKPNFNKYHLQETTYMMEGGNITIPCQPEGSPLPELIWSKDGIDLNLSPGGQDHIRQLVHGELQILQSTRSDDGIYTCTATNNLGSATSTTQMSILDSITISRGPTNTQVAVNHTAFLYCEASAQDGRYDVVYQWHFNGYPIDIENVPHFIVGTKANTRGLYIRRALFKHAGLYECHATTVFGDVSRSAYLTVTGPPGEPAGVYADASSISTTSVNLRWTMGVDHGSPIEWLIIEASTSNHPDVWKILDRGLSYASTQIQNDGKRQALLEGLVPYTAYRFRIRAINHLGIGEPSLPSETYQTLKAPPIRPPNNVGGGGGKTGTLVLIWEPFDQDDFGGDHFGYIVRWRQYGDGDRRWQMANKIGNANTHIVTIGDTNFYKQYEVTVGAYNELGVGPNSTAVIIFSSEGMPVGVPLNINGQELNATAIYISWDPVASVRSSMKGVVKGYQINYYDDSDHKRLATMSSKTFVYGDVSGGLVIALEPNRDYWFNVQVFNSAGLGPPSEEFRFSTYTNAPLNYPEYVNISSHGADSVALKWRGVSTGMLEEPLQGYKLRWWQANDDIREANDVITDKTTNGVISGLKRNIVYKVRVLGYSAGGDGALSPTVYFTLGGRLPAIDPAMTMFVAGGNTNSLHQIVFLFCLFSSAQKHLFRIN